MFSMILMIAWFHFFGLSFESFISLMAFELFLLFSKGIITVIREPKRKSLLPSNYIIPSQKEMDLIELKWKLKTQDGRKTIQESPEYLSRFMPK